MCDEANNTIVNSAIIKQRSFDKSIYKIFNTSSNGKIKTCDVYIGEYLHSWIKIAIQWLCRYIRFRILLFVGYHNLLYFRCKIDCICTNYTKISCMKIADLDTLIEQSLVNHESIFIQIYLHEIENNTNCIKSLCNYQGFYLGNVLSNTVYAVLVSLVWSYYKPHIELAFLDSAGQYINHIAVTKLNQRYIS